MELFQTLIRPDREENSQRAEVCKAANFLQVGEFQFLQLAYREWHKDEMPEELTNSIFKSYMLHDEVPHWARHYGRAEGLTNILSSGMDRYFEGASGKIS